jgi:YbbR domain-containing protein
MVDRVLVTVDAANMVVDEPEQMKLAITPVDAESNPVKAVNTDYAYVTLSATLFTVKSVPLYTHVDGTPGMGLELMSSNIPSTVSIKGRLLDLAKINYIDAEPLDIEGITSNTELEVVPILPEGVELASDNGSMIATFTLSDQGQVTLETDSSVIIAENIPEGMEAAFADEVTPLTVTIKGDIADITDITAEDIVLFADLSDIIEPGEYEIPVSGRAADERELEVTAEPASVFFTVTALESETEEEETPED